MKSQILKRLKKTQGYALALVWLVFLFSFQVGGQPLTQVDIFAGHLSKLPDADRDGAVQAFLQQQPVSPLIEGDSLFSLFWYGPAREVLVAGDLHSGWAVPDTLALVNCGPSGFFYRSWAVPPDSRLDYQLVVDGKSITDPLNPRITPSGFGPHSEVAMPGFRSHPLLWASNTFPLFSEQFLFTPKNRKLKPRRVDVLLPTTHESITDLLIVLDGLEAKEFMLYTNLLGNLLATDKIRPVAVVFLPPGERHVEYLGPRQEAFLQSLCDDLIPMLVLKYPALNEVTQRVISGISSGGHMAILAPLARPDVFQGGAGQSPTLAPDLPKALKQYIRKSKQNYPIRLYFDCGRFDLPKGTFGSLSFLEASRRFRDELQPTGIPFSYAEYNDGHEWASWRERTPAILQFFFGTSATPSQEK